MVVRLMGIFHIARVALGASAALAILAGCSGGLSPSALAPSGPGAGSQSVQRQAASAARADNSLLPPNVVRISHAAVKTASFFDPKAAGKALLFVSDAANGVVDIYPQSGKNPKMVGQITGLAQPQGLTTDASGNLYVANTNASNVLVYAPPYTGAPTLTIADPGEYPADVAVSSAGMIAVTNICDAPHCRLDTGNVVLFSNGTSKSCATVSDNAFNFTRVTFAEFDSSGDLYIDGLNGGYQTSIGLVVGGCQATDIIMIGQIYTVSFPGGLEIDTAGNIAVCDPGRLQVATFAPPVAGSFGDPVTTTPLNSSTLPIGLAVLSSGKDIYVADAGGAGSAQEYGYTAGGTAAKIVASGGQPIGVAVTPLAKERI